MLIYLKTLVVATTLFILEIYGIKGSQIYSDRIDASINIYNPATQLQENGNSKVSDNTEYACPIEAMEDLSQKLAPHQFLSQQYAFYEKVSDQLKENFVYCPQVIDAVVGMIYDGVASTSFNQLKELYFNDVSVEGVNSILNDIKNKLDDSGGDSSVVVRTVSKVAVEKTFQDDPIFVDYSNRVKAAHGVDVMICDFIRNGPEEARIINSYVENFTEGKIKDLLAPNEVKDDTRIILLAAIYIKASWLESFSPYERNLNFKALKGRESSVIEETGVKFMKLSPKNISRFQFGETTFRGIHINVATIPYKHPNLYFTLMMPSDPMQFYHFAKMSDFYEEIFKQGAAFIPYRKLDIFIMPKFKIETNESLDVKKIMKSLGISDIFGAKSDFSRMGSIPLFVATFVQKATIEVDEEGTVAAAAAAAMVLLKSVQIPKNIIVNKPFIFQLHLGNSAQQRRVLFTGQVTSAKSLQVG